MAQSNRMVLEALHACGAADALRNHKLPKDIRNEYELAYNGHDIRGRKLILKAYKGHLKKKAAGEHYDVLPLYYAVFLIHASGVGFLLLSVNQRFLLKGVLEQACVRGKEDIGAAMIAFKQLNTLTDEFPLKIELVPESGENWTVRMLLQNSTDTGMIISHSHFPLGKTREEYDRIKISS
ncbi:hypothetical protein BOTNAR_0160g00180 [Botryotinia narcissicola]|uniref:Uncharacterized protein n=1 Tax=Botryotinia narcissicola TaxID=278944 RepID=A0A4Z1IJ11_9HELO|nr:hypothetical protein BOTNAR_0160g00180 [Botryotinia narcissicola]